MSYPEQVAVKVNLNDAPTFVVNRRQQSVPLNQYFGRGTLLALRCLNIITGADVVLEASGVNPVQQLVIRTTSAGPANLSCDNGAMIGGKTVYVLPAYSQIDIIWNGSGFELQ